MKLNLSLLVLALACMSVARAQTEQGTKTLGLSLGYQKQTIESDPGTSEIEYKVFQFGPGFGYFIKDKLEIGGNLLYSFQKQLQDSGPNYYSKSETKQYGATIFLQKHIMFSDQFGVRTGPFLSYIHGENEQFYNGQMTNTQKQTSSTNTYQGGLNLGLEYFPSKRIGIAANLASLSYSHFKRENEYNAGSTEKGNSVDLTLTNALNLSVFWIFGAK